MNPTSGIQKPGVIFSLSSSRETIFFSCSHSELLSIFLDGCLCISLRCFRTLFLSTWAFCLVWLPATGQQLSSWLSWGLRSFVTLPAPGEEEVNSVVKREEGMAHGRVTVTQPNKQESWAKAPTSNLQAVLSLQIAEWHVCSWVGRKNKSPWQERHGV